MSTSKEHTLMTMVKDLIPIVDTAYNNLLVSNEFYKYIPKIKMNATSKSYIEEAYKQWSDGDRRLALEYFTQAIAFAENRTDQLPECYNDRANILQVMNYFEKAAEDLNRALKQYKKNLNTKKFLKALRTRLGNSRREYTIPVRRLPRIPDYEINETFPCSTTNIRIVSAETKGQRVIATSRLHISENIVVEKPLVVASGVHKSILFCHECMLFCLNPVPCSSCSHVTFCGEICKESAWRRYHKYECYIQYITDKHKQYRIVVKIALSFHDYIDLQDDSYCPEEYKDILNRETSSEYISDETKNAFAAIAAQVFHGLREYTTFFTDITNPKKFNIFKGLFMKLMLLVNEYRFDFTKGYRYFCKKTPRIFKISYIGIYPFSLHFRTGCSPNVSVDYCETYIVIKTLRIIKPGEELFVVGEYNYTTTPKEERQAIYQKKYATVCKCEACENNWPLGKDLERICKSSVTFSLHMLYERFRKTRNLHLFLEHAHARAKDYVGVYLVGPSLEWLSWQHFLVIAHQRLCANCETVIDFLRRRPFIEVSETNISSRQ